MIKTIFCKVTNKSMTVESLVKELNEVYGWELELINEQSPARTSFADLPRKAKD